MYLLVSSPMIFSPAAQWNALLSMLLRFIVLTVNRTTKTLGISLKRSTEGCERMTEIFSVSSLEEYIKIVERFSPNFSLSRGQGSDLPLFPSALKA